MIIVLIYVDDILITGDSLQHIIETKTSLYKAFKINDLGELKYFLEIEFAWSEQGIVMHQRKYPLELIYEAVLSAAKPKNAPTKTISKLTTQEYDKYTKYGTRDDDLLTDQGTYIDIGINTRWVCQC